MCLLGPPLIHMLMLTRLQYYTIDFLPPSELPENNIFSIEDIERSLNSLKSEKAPGIVKISKEHILFSHPAVFVHVFAYLIV